MGHLQTQVSLSQCLQALCPIPECNVRCTRDMFQTVFGGHQSLGDILHKVCLCSIAWHVSLCRVLGCVLPTVALHFPTYVVLSRGVTLFCGLPP